jgi:adenine-specific DNA-methyltransferase
MKNLQNELIDLLKHEDNLVIDGHLNKNKIVELALKVEPQLIILLLKSDTFKKHFFQEVENVLVFDKIKFQRFVNNKSFLPDSYTAFKNKIGLITNDDDLDNFISTSNDVVLAWPHKDCVLEGGQTKEDQKRNEIFWNETLAPDSVDRLLDPKALTNFKKFDKDGEHKVTEINGNENLIIKGNNLLVLASILKTHRGKIKLIYIDPPYNTGDDFGYNDKFNHSAWLTFMKNRLKIAKKLLTSDGTIWINIGDDEVHYLKILSDEIFGRECFLGNIIWEKSDSPKMDAQTFSSRHDHLLVFAKDANKCQVNKISNNVDGLKHYNKKDENGRIYYLKPLRAMGKNGTRIARPTMYYHIDAPDGTKIYPKNKDGSDSCWRWSEERLKKDLSKIVINNTINGWSVNFKIYADDNSSKPPETIWFNKEVGSNRTSKKEIKSLFDDQVVFSTPKPESLMKRILEISSNENDIVMDFFAGSATTAAVALKMKRKFITSEQMEYINDVSVVRLHKVLNGEQGGISVEMDWQGGGSFVYAELMQYNQKYIDAIQNAEKKEQLITVWNDMQDTAFLSYQFDKKTFNDRLDAFKTAPIEEMKQYLVEILDKNQLYVNYSEMEDATFNVSVEDKKLNKQFYSK